MNNSKQETQIEPSTCNECGGQLNDHAKRCHLCGSYQKFNWLEFFKSLSSATAFLIVLVSIGTLMQTCQEKQNAEVAVIAAKQALKDTEKAKFAAETAKVEAISQAKELISTLGKTTKTELEKIAKETSASSESVETLGTLIEEERSKLKILSDETAIALKGLKTVEDKIEFQQIVDAARKDDRKSYDQLKIWLEDKMYPFQKQAKTQHDRIERDLSDEIRKIEIQNKSTKYIEQSCAISVEYSLHDLVGLYYSMEDLIKRNIGNLNIRPYLIIYVAERRTDISLKERLQFLINIIASDNSLINLRLADIIFWENAKKEARQLMWTHRATSPHNDYHFTLKYWNDHKNEY
ncbi:hypothetical protein FCL47_23500 [Desulfopila sp. IMCC35006]|uniref:hypothetical protein n=1 Tax=Desulfopila sp. IMCC35006 TaxID=2569542 RepID=UPI0010AD1522|nr:hypothetical protein [Desulfopila sp. IMCC35006]TKB23181.1 hypothetical protein FCL47_23500 [Desulfopila sp. IMCC35006]